MSGGWNAKPDQRETAHRLWDAKMPKKRIAKLVGVSEWTISHWRWEDKWAARTRYEDRPIKMVKRPPEAMQEGGREESPTCWVCGGRSPTWDGHTQCRGPSHTQCEVAA
jgi:hypothetical protein